MNKGKLLIELSLSIISNFHKIVNNFNLVFAFLMALLKMAGKLLQILDGLAVNSDSHSHIELYLGSVTLLQNY